MDNANTIESGAIVAISSSGTTPADTPKNTSAPSSASATPPVSLRGLVRPANSALNELRLSRPACTMPWESSTTTSVMPLFNKMLAQATPAAPAPEITTFNA
nr:hypothetical protein CPGR_00940 [Mycolicibacterium fortuitum subsp. fortuitum DSM 46621 = ATCC 6841 = JCM 6387]